MVANVPRRILHRLHERGTEARIVGTFGERLDALDPTLRDITNRPRQLNA
ncbi:MAG: hypothetical protein QM831_37775 [Kofleriaceae bacterium]